MSRPQSIPHPPTHPAPGRPAWHSLPGGAEGLPLTMLVGLALVAWFLAVVALSSIVVDMATLPMVRP